MRESWDSNKAEKFIEEKQKENEGLINGMFGCAIKHYLLNKKSIAAARKLLRIYKAEKYQNYLKTKCKKLS